MRDIPEQVTMLETSEEYKKFTEKFKPKKTTDDCYTPDNIYRAILDWVMRTYGVEEKHVVRPFYPGGDFEHYDYSSDSVVVDNPPFSILARIVKYYSDRDIKYFLFAPSLTNFGTGHATCHIITGANITYENGANVITSFLTNLDQRLVYGPTELYKIIEAENKANLKKDKKELPKYEYPDEVLTAAKVQWFVKHGVEYELEKSEALFIRSIDSQAATGKAIFGGGFLLSERAAAERAAAERWRLSDREQDLVKRIGRRRPCETTND